MGSGGCFVGFGDFKDAVLFFELRILRSAIASLARGVVQHVLVPSLIHRILTTKTATELSQFVENMLFGKKQFSRIDY